MSILRHSTNRQNCGLRRGWGFRGKGSSGEILLRLTYKAYVEDEEDDKTGEDLIDIDASDDELSDTEEANVTDQKGVRDSMYQIDKESFMDVLDAIIVSEEFQGIVTSEVGFTKGSENGSNTTSKVSKSLVANAESTPSSSDKSEGSGVVQVSSILETVFDNLHLGSAKVVQKIFNQIFLLVTSIV
ncbi:uncharacterized protein LOC127080921 [Lathyrus oleraceus]|uniref:uncharacterized protein LOC127080921 n=1 Tax=Pisum sativum TaxID=3888 RepID=UPI0021D26690|nr:uncharacterized protein LOC127080921 [Pisum sativum]